VSITLPPSQYSRSVTVTRGPTTNRICITENQPSGPPVLIIPSQQQLSTRLNTSAINASPARAAIPSLDNERLTRSPDSSFSMLGSLAANVSSASSISLDALDLGSPSHVDTLENTPSSLGHRGPPSHLRGCPPEDKFRVSDEVLKRYPAFTEGWRQRSWVVVFRGRDYGIFYDFWYVF
jgi:hypothetical protein